MSDAAAFKQCRAHLAQVLDLLAEDSWLNVYAGELEVAHHVRPPSRGKAPLSRCVAVRYRLARGTKMNEALRRPFYAEYAWAFDLLIDRPVEKECGVIAAWLVGREILPGAGILDAGCGTGRYSRELARRGYLVRGVDLSPELIEVAKRTAGDRTGGVSFAVADILAPPTARYAAILCRGVLNDITDNDRREAVFAAFARALRPNGALIVDVREWGASAERKTREPVFRKRVSTDRGELTFTSVTELDAEHRLLLISERHELVGLGDERVSDYQFVMRCWEREELSMLFARHGFGNIQFFGAYDHGVEPGATDRLIAVVQLSDDADKP